LFIGDASVIPAHLKTLTDVHAAALAQTPSANKKNEDIVTDFNRSRQQARRSRIACCGITLAPRRMPHPY
jgi:hypothetical protein